MHILFNSIYVLVGLPLASVSCIELASFSHKAMSQVKSVSLENWLLYLFNIRYTCNPY